LIIKKKHRKMSQVGVPTKVVVHPLVLLSVVDHYNRVAKDTKNRVAGVLLGEFSGGVVDVTNSFAGNASRN
jgi:26S proteasome regulatory subunit N8